MSLTDKHDDWCSLSACAQSDLFFPLSSASVCAPQITAAKAGGFTEDEPSRELQRGAEGLAALYQRGAL
jgi:hypothetical protein